jgi:hypothetical protein
VASWLVARWRVRGLALALAALAAGAGACLPEDPPVSGRLLYPGVNILNPRFRVLAGEPWVLFDLRTSRAEEGLASRQDLHLVRFSDGAHELVLTNRADRGDWPVVTDAERASFYMTDERIAADLGQPVGTLVRMRLGAGVVETLDDVMGYGLHPDRRWYFYRKYMPGASGPELHLRDLAGNDRNLGTAAGSVSFFGPAGFYFLAGTDRVLTRVTGLDGPPETLRPRVSRYWLDEGQRFAVLALSEDGQARTRILDLATREERALPVENPCCWLRLDGDTFTYAEAAADGLPAVLHQFHLPTGEDRALPLPDGLEDVRAIIDRPDHPEAILVDRGRRAARLRIEGEAGDLIASTAELLPVLTNAPVFTADGRFLLYMEVEPPPPPPAVRRRTVGRLMVQDASDWQAPPRLLTPAGTRCMVEPRGYVANVGDPGKVLFWAHFGLAASDLYLSDLDSGETRKLAVGVGPMTMVETRLVGITRIGQDHTGDLVQKDLLTAREQVLEHGVASVTTRLDPMLGDIAAFVVRERNPTSPRNGLWAAPLPAF